MPNFNNESKDQTGYQDNFENSIQPENPSRGDNFNDGRS